MHYIPFASRDYLEIHGVPESMYDAGKHRVLMHSGYNKQMELWHEKMPHWKAINPNVLQSNSSTVILEDLRTRRRHCRHAVLHGGHRARASCHCRSSRWPRSGSGLPIRERGDATCVGASRCCNGCATASARIAIRGFARCSSPRPDTVEVR